MLHALRLDGRVSFRRVAAALGSSEQTVARRYRRLREAGVVNVIAVRPVERSAPRWIVRVGVAPAAALAVAGALAGREDVAWVSVTEGGSEIVCSVRPSGTAARDELLLKRLPSTSRVTSVTAFTLLHVFADGPPAEWQGLPDPLTAAQAAALAPAQRCEPPPDPMPLDDALLEALTADARATYATLAARTGASEARVARRLELLRAGGAVVVESELAAGMLGFPVHASLWLTVAPSRLDVVGTALSALPESTFTAAISGSANLLVQLTCRAHEDLYALITGPVGALKGIVSVRTAVVVRRLKSERTLLDGSRLAFRAG